MNNKTVKTMRFVLLGFVCMLLVNTGYALQQSAEKLNHPQLTNAVYKKNSTLWTADNKSTIALRKRLMELVDKSSYKGLSNKKYHTEVLHAIMRGEAVASAKEIECYFTDAAISYCKDLVKAPEQGKWLKYDDVSKNSNKDDNSLVNALADINNTAELNTLVASREPQEHQYQELIGGLAEELEQETKDIIRIKKLRISLSYYRWINHFKFDKYIVVNIASAKLRYYEYNNVALMMKIVAGDTPTETPRFAAYCNQLTLYPYWYVPRSIAVKEMLPFCKENEKNIADLNLQVLDNSGKVVNPASLNWQKFTPTNFPYNFRHVPGCDNPLGLIKFNLTDPFDIYMHDTNLKPAFKQKKRFYSHGCVRLERPDQLANIFLDEKLDSDFLHDCKENQKPKVKSFSPIPVFVVYMPAEVTEPGHITLYNDVYKLL